MGSTRKKTVPFLPPAWDFYQILHERMHECMCAYVCVHVFDTPCSMSFDWHNHVITGSWLLILREDTLQHPMQSLQICSIICLPLARIVGWWWPCHWDVFTWALYYTGYIYFGVVCRSALYYISHLWWPLGLCLPHILKHQKNPTANILRTAHVLKIKTELGLLSLFLFCSEDY